MKLTALATVFLAISIVSCCQPGLVGKPQVSAEQVQSFNFYEQATMAIWVSGAGTLSFSDSEHDQNGYVRKIDAGSLQSGVRAVSMIETHPQMKNQGWIEGRYPEIILGEGLFFHTYVGFRHGADASDGVSFQVFVHTGEELNLVASQRLFPRQVKKLDADLSPWAGKKVQIILKVLAGKSNSQDQAVWVDPHLDNKPSRAD